MCGGIPVVYTLLTTSCPSTHMLTDTLCTLSHWPRGGVRVCLTPGKGDAEMVQAPDEPVAPGLSRRAFLVTTGGTLTGAVACGLVSQAPAGANQPQRGGTLRFATRGDAAGLDPHRNTIYLVSTLL